MKKWMVVGFLSVAFMASCGGKSPPPSRVICDGSFNMEGTLQLPPHSTLPSQLSRMVKIPVLNRGTRGINSIQLEERAGGWIDSQYLENDVILYWAGEDSFTFDQLDAPTIYRSFKRYTEARKQKGFRIAILTLLQNSVSSHPNLASVGFEAFRRAYNDLIRENTAEANWVIDLDQETRLSSYTDSTYFPPLLGLTHQGYGLVAEMVKEKLAL